MKKALFGLVMAAAVSCDNGTAVNETSVKLSGPYEIAGCVMSEFREGKLIKLHIDCKDHVADIWYRQGSRVERYGEDGVERPIPEKATRFVELYHTYATYKQLGGSE